MKYVVVDIDGTIAANPKRQFNIINRLKYVPVEDMPWDKLFEGCEHDIPIEPIVDLVRALSHHYRIVFCTSRNIAFRDRTRDWIDKHTCLIMAPILMRRSPEDHRSDTIVKPELLAEADITPRNTAFIIEDKISTVQAWRDLGFTVLQPMNNEY